MKPSSWMSSNYVFEIAEAVNFAKVACDLFIADHGRYMHEAAALLAPEMGDVEIAALGHRQELDSFLPLDVVEQLRLLARPLQLALEDQVRPVRQTVPVKLFLVN